MSRPCARCDEGGTIECPKCDGDGKVKRMKYIPFLTEVMDLVDDDFTAEDECSKCSGTGEVACPACNGAGSVGDDEDN